MLATIGFAFLAGIFSILSPCVLPLVPLVLGAAVSEHRLGPAALAGGLALSFTSVGLFVATIGFAAGIDAGIFRMVAAILMSILGIVLIVPRFQAQFALAAGPVGNWAEQRLGGFSTAGISGQFVVGLLLGVVWAPCVGPTLGAASIDGREERIRSSRSDHAFLRGWRGTTASCSRDGLTRDDNADARSPRGDRPRR